MSLPVATSLGKWLFPDECPPLVPGPRKQSLPAAGRVVDRSTRTDKQMAQTGLLKQKSISSQFWRLEAQGQGVSMCAVTRGLTPWLVHLLLCLHTVVSLCEDLLITY